MNQKLLILNSINIFKQVIGSLLIIYGLYYLVVYLNILAVFYLVLGLIMLTRSGTEINLENKKYRSVFSLFGLSFGVWKDLPKIDYISVFKTKIVKKHQVYIASTYSKLEVIKLILFYQKNKRIEVYQTENIDDAFNTAKFVADILKIDILDSTKKPSVWLKM
jgi:hypothetical protein